MKMIYNHYDSETGISKVVLADKRGKYTGKAKLNPNEKNTESRFAGLRLAEYRAWINYFKSEVRRIREKLNTVKSLKKDMDEYDNPNKKVQRRVNLKIRDYSQELTDLKKAIDELKKRLDE